jgi:hypothetical protein
MLKRLVYFGTAACLTTSYMFAGTHSMACGQRVSDANAARVRGGVCQSLGTVDCPNPGVQGCQACTKVVGGLPYYGVGTGDCYCSGSCGSFFTAIQRCTR